MELSLVQGKLHDTEFLFRSTLGTMTRPCLTLCSGDAFSDSTFGEGWKLALIFPFSLLPLARPISLPGSL